MNTITGTVEEVRLVENKKFSTIHQGTVDTPVEVSATVLLEDGRRAYVRTKVATKSETPGPGFAIHYRLSADGEQYQTWQRKPTGKKDGWPWALVGEGGVSSSEQFNVALVYWTLELMVWAGDKVTIRGTVEAPASGKNYLNVKRAKILSLEREW